jgi:GNAT superfamily N-acetyltransferase
MLNAHVELRREAADGPAARSLFDEYMALVRERLGEDFEPTQDIFATEDAFATPGGAWIVLYENGRAVGCGGLRRLDGDAAEIKRMFVTAEARGRGHGRRLLRELEALAVAGGATSVTLLTTEVLVEARALYAAEGYRVVARGGEGERCDLWLRKDVARPMGNKPD